MKNARHNQTIYRVSLPYLLVSAVTCTSRCTLWDVTVRLTNLGRFQVKVCHKAEEILCCHLPPPKWGWSSPVSFSKCSPGDTARGWHLSGWFTLKTYRDNLQTLPEQILWQTHISISLCNSFSVSITSCTQNFFWMEAPKWTLPQGRGAVFQTAARNTV